MPALTKKKVRTKVRGAGTSRAKPDTSFTAVRKDLNKLLDMAESIGKKVKKRTTSNRSYKTVTGQSKGMRGSETKRKRSPHRG
jgi:hypothetical protein